MYMSTATKKYKWVCEENPKVKAFRHFKVKNVQKFDD